MTIDIAGLGQIVGDSNVLTGKDAEALFTDARKVHFAEALAVVRPASTDEVAAVVRWCVTNDVAISSQGGNTGLSGGAIPWGSGPAVIMSLQRMNQIEKLDPDGWTMTVQAGVLIQTMQEAAVAEHRLFAPDWGARGSATIGGAIATDAGGNNVVRYGNMRDQIMGVEVVMADGEIWNGLRSLRKDSSGYDLKQLFVGSEGTLGIITRAVVKLHQTTPHEQSALAALSSLDDLMDVFALAKDSAGDALTAFELLPEVGIQKVCDTYDLVHPMETRADFYVLIKLGSNRPVTDLLTDFLALAADAGQITDAVVAATPEQEIKLWTLRDELPPTGLYTHHATGIKMDTAVPIARMGEFHNSVREIAAELAPYALTYGFGHVGDGNLHMNVLPMGEADIAKFKSVKPELMRRIDELTFSMGGTLSAEHGVGRDLRDRVVGQKSSVEWKLMRTIKAALDPDNRLNPGVLIPDP